MKKTSLKTRILLFTLMLLMVVSLGTAAIVPIKNAIEKNKESEKTETTDNKNTSGTTDKDDADNTEEGYY